MKLVAAAALLAVLGVVTLGAQAPVPTPQDRMYAAIRSGDTAAVATLVQEKFDDVYPGAE